MTHHHELRGTLIGLSAIFMWATLAALTAFCREVPPFQLTAMAFAIATGIGLFWMRGNGLRLASLVRIPPFAWLVGVAGLFGFHLFYFVALRYAPVLQASLIVYLWPLLIVLFSSFLPGERLRWFNLAGALAGLFGAGLIVSGGAAFSFTAADLAGYLLALGAALTWAGYSVISRRLASVPSYAITGFCAVTALLALSCHLLFERTVVPGAGGLLAIAGLGLGPVGGAFFTWDVGMKTGNIKVLGALSYGAPLLSTILLLSLGLAAPGWSLGVACLLIVGGSLLASGEFLAVCLARCGKTGTSRSRRSGT